MRTSTNSLLQPRPLTSALADRRTRWGALAASCVLHLLLLGGLVFLPRGLPLKERREVSARVRFTKAAPPRQRPLARRVLPVPMQRPLVRRQQAQAAPTVAARPSPTTAAAGSRPGSGGTGSGQGSGEGWGIGEGEAGGGFLGEGTGTLGQGLPAGTGMGLGGGGGIGPKLRAGAVGGQRAGGDEIDLGLELLDATAMDTGRHRALVITDTKNKKGLKGYLYLSGVYSACIEQAELDAAEPRPFGETRQLAERRLLGGLSQIMSEHTQVRTQVLDAVALDDPGLLQVPFVVLTAHSEFRFAETEAANLGRYLLSGGFLYVEVATQAYASQAIKGLWDLPSLRALLRAAFEKVGMSEGKDWSFRRLELNHPLFHCFFDIAALPRGYWDVYAATITPVVPPMPEYVEGICMGDRLVGLYSQKDYGFFWGDGAQRRRENSDWIAYAVGGGEELLPARFGVNVLVYGLTQEGSLARRLVAAE